MKILMTAFLIVATSSVCAQDSSKGTCPTIHACTPPGMTKEQWANDPNSHPSIPPQRTLHDDMADYRKEHWMKATIGMKVSADDLFAHNERPCEKVNRTITAHGERDQVICAPEYIYIDDGIITSIQR